MVSVISTLSAAKISAAANGECNEIAQTLAEGSGSSPVEMVETGRRSGSYGRSSESALGCGI